MIIEFGKYKGSRLEDLPEDYLLWLLDMRKKDVRIYEGELERRKLAEEASLTMSEKIISAGYRELAKKFHPDAGGSAKEFQELRASFEQLQSVMKEARAEVKLEEDGGLPWK